MPLLVSRTEVAEDRRQEEEVAMEMAETVAEEEAEEEEAEVTVNPAIATLMPDQEQVSLERMSRARRSSILIKNKEAGSKDKPEMLILSTDNLELEEARESRETRKGVLEKVIGETSLTRSTSKVARLRSLLKVQLSPKKLLPRRKDNQRSRKKKWKSRRLKKSFLEWALTTS